MFEWKTGDDEWPEEDTAITDHPPSFPLPRKKIKIVVTGLFLVLVVLVGASLAFGRINSRVTAVTHSLEDQILDVNTLLLKTAVARDDELFQTLLSHRHGDWHDTQVRLLNRNLFLNRSPLALWLDDLNQAEITGDVILSSDLSEATVVATLPYLTLTPEEEPETIMLQRTAIFQKQGEAWLLDEPDDEFWGQYVHVKRPWLDLVTPERDRNIAQQLADDLNPLIQELCTSVVTACPQDFVLQLHLDRGDHSLLNMYSNVRHSAAYLGGTTRFSLPAPTLVGLPVDEAAYAAFLRGYSTHVALALLNVFDADNYGLVGDVIVTPDFKKSLLALGLFVPWPPEYHPGQVAEPPPIPLPDKEIVMMCQGSRAPILYLNNLEDTLWQELTLDTEGAPGYYNFLMPGGRGILLSTTSIKDGLTRLIWLNGGYERQLLLGSSFPDVRDVTELDPGRYLINYHTYEQVDDEPAIERQQFRILEECDDERCQLEPFTQEMVLSPGGRFSFIASFDEEAGLLYQLGDGEGNILQDIGPAYNPLWLDEYTLAFIRRRSRDQANDMETLELVTAVFPENENEPINVQTRVTEQDLTNIFNIQGEPSRFQINSFFVDGQQPGHLLLSTNNGQSSNNFPRSTLFSYDWQGDLLTLWPEMPSKPVGIYAGTSPKGRFLIFINGSFTYTINLFDRLEKRWLNYTLATPRFVWGNFAFTDDDEWLLLTDADAVHLIAPAYEYERLLFHGQRFCESAAWIDWVGANQQSGHGRDPIP